MLFSCSSRVCPSFFLSQHKQIKQSTFMVHLTSTIRLTHVKGQVQRNGHQEDEKIKSLQNEFASFSGENAGGFKFLFCFVVVFSFFCFCWVWFLTCFHGFSFPLFISQVLVKFLFHVVEMAASRVNMITRSSFVNLGSPSEEVFLLKLFGCILTCLTHLLKSGLLSHQSLMVNVFLFANYF